MLFLDGENCMLKNFVDIRNYKLRSNNRSSAGRKGTERLVDD